MYAVFNERRLYNFDLGFHIWQNLDYFKTFKTSQYYKNNQALRSAWNHSEVLEEQQIIQ